MRGRELSKNEGCLCRKYMLDYIYDIESYPNVFTLTLTKAGSSVMRQLEISERRNDFKLLQRIITKFKQRGDRMVGFNNIGYDYPVIHHLLEAGSAATPPLRLAELAYEKTCDIIEGDYNLRFTHVVWSNQWKADQLDLFKIHHFDNVARATSLKMLEFNMRLKRISDLPFPPGTILTSDQIDVLLEYNIDDVEATERFYDITLPKIKFRETLSKQYDRDFMNHNDTKIGKDFFIMELERLLGNHICYDFSSGKREPRQTLRPKIELNSVIFDSIEFSRPEFNAVLDWMKAQVITETKGVFTEIPEKALGDVAQYANLKKVKGRVKNLNCIVDGFQFDFGTGGIHGSLNNRAIKSDDQWVIWSSDVKSMYPNIAIANRVYPEHLTEKFCDIYLDVYNQRNTFPKGTPENAMLKLALNGVYGDSNNRYSPFFDPAYTMSITINGQLLMCMLAEQLMEIEDSKLLMINTDGLEIKIKREHEDWLMSVCKKWESTTGLILEHDTYSKLYIRDCNNYVGVFENEI